MTGQSRVAGLCELLNAEDARYVVFTIDGVAIPTVSLAHLIESKRTGRTQDQADIEIIEALRRLRNE